MKRGDMLPSGPDQRWRGLELRPTTPATPDLRVEIAPPWFLRIVQGSEPVLFGEVHRDHCGVSVLRTGAFMSVCPPISAREARRFTPESPADWYQRWTHFFAGALEASELSPLHEGRWTLRPAHIASESAALKGPGLAGPRGVDSVVVDFDRRLLEDDPDVDVDWRWSGNNAVLPLRVLSDPAAARIKALRKQVRDLTLPPVLVWWINGLSCSVILDGHDRFLAALVEGVAPPLLELASVLESDDPRIGDQVARSKLYVDQLRRFDARGENTSAHAGAVAKQLAQIQLQIETNVRTRAWPIDGGEREWREQVAHCAPAWRSPLD